MNTQTQGIIVKVFRNKYYTKRNYDCTNIVCCTSATMPTHDTNGNLITDGRWVESRIEEMEGNHLFTSGGVRYFGYL